MLGILLIAKPCNACRVFCWTRHPYKRSIFPAWCLQLSKTKQNAKTVLMRLATPINAHQNANQKPIGSAPAYRVQCTLPPQPIYQTLLFNFQRSGSETTQSPRCVSYNCECSDKSTCRTLSLGCKREAGIGIASYPGPFEKYFFSDFSNGPGCEARIGRERHSKPSNIILEYMSCSCCKRFCPLENCTGLAY